ncbi:hypothetical protein D3C85_16160 [compost metagenome]
MSNIGNFVYERAIDYIRNRARDNDLREAYDRYMSAQNYNNPEMNKLVDVTIVLVEDALRSARSGREEEELALNTVAAVIDANVGSFALSDRRISDALPDDIYRDIKAADTQWRRLAQAANDMSRGYDNRSGGVFGNQQRSVFTDRPTPNVFGGSGSVFDRTPAPSPDSTPARSGGLWAKPGERDSRPAEPARDQTAWPAREAAPAAQAPTAQPTAQNGPDKSKDRPYDDFWVDGEHWQLAHKSSWTWSFSTKQQTRRTYDPDMEVCFLVKDKSGHVREEFLPVTEDLIEASHEIRTTTRPNSRFATERESGDVFSIGDDIDAVDLDALNKTITYVRRQLIGELDTSNPDISDEPQTISNLNEAALRVAGEAVRCDKDVLSINAFVTVPMAADKKTLEALESVRASSSGESDLQIMARRLASLRGVMAENVMNFIDGHFTDEVNSALRDQFGLDITIDSFVGDFEDLLNCKTFRNLGASATSQFLARTRVVLASLHYVVDSDQRLEIINALDVLPAKEDGSEAYEQFRETTAVMFKPMAVLHVKIDSDKFGMVGKEVRTPQRSGQFADVPLATALTSLFHIGRKTSGAGRVYMVTADNIMFELVPISGARDVIGIRLA